MRLSKIILVPGIFIAAALIAIFAAWASVGVIERVTKTTVERQLVVQGEDWAHVAVDGLQVILDGIAPTETDRFQALTIAGGEVDSSRVIDRMVVPSSQEVAPPRFSIEILRNDAGISMIGLIPAATDREALTQRVSRIIVSRRVADLLETADYPVPDGWDAALDFAVYALEELPRSKISMSSERVEVEAIADSEAQKDEWEQDLARRAPTGLRVALNISAPRPVVTPFTARFVIDETGARFDACTAGTEIGRTKIVGAGIAAGVKGRPNCVIGLGVPSADWPDAVALGVNALREMGSGTITYADADVTLVADASVEQRAFDRVVGELEADLPEVFSLHATRTAREDGDGEGAQEFTATLSPEGNVQLRGRLTNEQQRAITESVARARFGMDSVYMATRLDQGLPPEWSVRVLASLEALSFLDNGAAIVQPDRVELRGKTGNPDAKSEISRLLSEKLGSNEEFRVNVTYDEALDPVASLPSARECVIMINDAIRKNKITFAPGSVEIEASAAGTIRKIADMVRQCPDVAMEIGGHTDSQGSEELNKSLSQQRANSVLNALLAERVLTSNLTAYGYGEEQPVADNDTEEGREENRRIEFKLIGTEDLPDNIAPDGSIIEDISEGAVQTADEDLGSVRPRPRPGGDDDAEAVEADDAAAEAPVTDDAAVTDETAAENPPETAAQDATEVPEDASASETDAEVTEADERAETTSGETEDTATEESEGNNTSEAATDTEGDITEEETADVADENGATIDAETNGAEDTETEETPPEEPLGPAIVVDPELEGVRAPPRPER